MKRLFAQTQTEDQEKHFESRSRDASDRADPSEAQKAVASQDASELQVASASASTGSAPTFKMEVSGQQLRLVFKKVGIGLVKVLHPKT